MQAFLEQYPSMVPGAFCLKGNQRGHFPCLCGLISQPPLPSYDRRIPDLMWISLSSDTEEPILIEIEAPDKHWFAASGNQTAHLTHTLNQVAEWKAWFNKPHNIQAFKAFYGLETARLKGVAALDLRISSFTAAAPRQVPKATLRRSVDIWPQTTEKS